MNQPATCPNCGTPPRPLDLYCGVCGQSLKNFAGHQENASTTTTAEAQAVANDTNPLFPFIGAKDGTGSQRIIIIFAGASIIACTCLCIFAALLSAGG